MPRNAFRVVVVLATAAVALLAHSLLAPPTAQADVCDHIPSLPVPDPLKTGCKVAEKAPQVVTDPGQAATDIATAPFRAAGDQVMQGVTDWVANGAVWLLGQAGTLIDRTTSPQLRSAWFEGQYAAMVALAAVFALPLLLLSVLQGVVRRDGGVVLRAAFVQLPLAFLLTGMAVTVAALSIQLTDELCASIAGSVGTDARAFFHDTATSLGKLAQPAGTDALPLFAVFLGALLAALGALFVWIELLIRSAAIYAAVLFLPFTFVAMVWPHTARWCKRLVEVLVSIVLAKFVIVAVMALAAAGLGQSRGSDAFAGVLAGAALMLMATLSPFALLRLIPLAEATVQSTGSRSGTGSSTMTPAAHPASVMRQVMSSNWGGVGGGGLRAAPTGPVTVGGGAMAGAAMVPASMAVARTATSATSGGLGAQGPARPREPSAPSRPGAAVASPGSSATAGRDSASGAHAPGPDSASGGSAPSPAPAGGSATAPAAPAAQPPAPRATPSAAPVPSPSARPADPPPVTDPREGR